jgi:hypothetical protein
MTLMDLATCRTSASAIPSSTLTPSTGPRRITESMESQIIHHGHQTALQVARQSGSPSEGVRLLARRGGYHPHVSRDSHTVYTRAPHGA